MQDARILSNPNEATTAPNITRFQSVEKICTAFQIESLKPQLDAVRASLKDDGIVNVAVVGRFKAGKSSFLNELFGTPVIPVGVLPVTAVVTTLCNGSRDRARVVFLSGRSEEVRWESLPEYVTEKLNPDNQKGVGIVELEIAALRPYDGIRFVDTPGMGSTFKHNTKTSMDWLPNIGAALVAVAVDSPLSEDDIDLLGRLTRHTPEIAVLLTKADLVSEDQLREVKEFILEQTKKSLTCDLPIFPFSVKPGFESRREDFRQFLLGRIAGNRKQKYSEILGHKIQSVAEDCRDYLLLARKAAQASQAAREELRGLLENERMEIDRVKNEMKLIMGDLKRRVEDSTRTRYKKFQTEMTDRLKNDLNEKLPTWHGSIAEISAEYSKWFPPTLESELELVFPRGEKFVAPFISEAEAAYTRIIKAFQDRLSENIKKALDISFAGAKFQCEIQHPERPDIRVGKTFNAPFELIHFLIPMRIFRKTINRHLVRRLPWEVEKNLSRLSMQWSGAMYESISRLAGESWGFMRRELDTIGSLVVGDNERLQEIDAAIADIGRV